jgi:hypothetical protein
MELLDRIMRRLPNGVRMRWFRWRARRIMRWADRIHGPVDLAGGNFCDP